MKPMARLMACLPPGLIACSLLLAACGSYQARPADRNPLAPDPERKQPLGYYRAQLAELPLRIQSYDLAGVQRQRPVVIRDLHVVHDNVRDEILIVDRDAGANHMWSLDCYNFTLHWRTMIEKRVDYTPLPTRNYIYLMNSDGEYQAFDRLSQSYEEDSRLVSMGRFEGDLFPSAQPASNDSHVFVPATNSNSIKGREKRRGERGRGEEGGGFPNADSAINERFMAVTKPPAADGETVAFVNDNDYLYMVDAQNGDFRASMALDGHSRTNPLIKDDLVFVGSDVGQLYAWQKSGESAWIAGIEGLPYGDIFVEDNWVFVRTLEVYDEEITDKYGDTVLRANVRPGKLMAFKYRLIEVEGDRPIYDLVDGDPSTKFEKEPIWEMPDVGQQVLMLNGDQLFVLYEDNEEFLSKKEVAKLRDSGRVVSKRDELRTRNRTLKIFDVNTGLLERPEYSFNMMDFPFVVGSMEERDRAIYLATKDGYVFRLHADAKSSAGGR